MNHRTRVRVAVASMLPLGLGVVICGLLVATGAATADVASALTIAVIAQGIFTYLRLRRTAPTTRRGQTGADNNL
ncbi:hypothetical protein NONO_c21820 [Nocardia nova SH22a]|uniref:Uncharacterized protein n=1 Tax=Nocardia nova SH22a TaxID=1415166 RepID=W5TCB0_9NOCA|nr:hypothetical protein [Nocardia nova]AHH16980.1 hypothetical protein NONO_c21820 [Nocardia nova SH22a]